jgi:hypothetical protein
MRVAPLRWGNGCMALTIHSITFDCSRPSVLAAFWAQAIGYKMRPYDEAEIQRLKDRGIHDVADDPSVAVDAPGHGPTLFFTRVPEPKSVKNRVHLDLSPDTDMEEEVDRLVGLGATVHDVREEEGRRWTVMLDPEGNEFCVESA